MNAKALEYSKWSIVVVLNDEFETECVKHHGRLTVKPKHAEGPVWTFSKKRLNEIERLAKKFGVNVTVYSEDSVAIPAPAYVSELLEADGLFQPRLKDGRKRFAGWVFRAKNAAKAHEVCQKLAS